MTPMEIRKATPMTERYVTSVLRRTGEVGLYERENHIAYFWRGLELRHPRLAKFAALFRFGPQIAFGV